MHSIKIVEPFKILYLYVIYTCMPGKNTKFERGSKFSRHVNFYVSNQYAAHLYKEAIPCARGVKLKK